MKTQGIYKITNQINNNIYIGQSSNIELREQYHKKDLVENKHHQKNLQKEFNNLVVDVINKNKDNDLFKYINFRDFVFDKYYKLEVIDVIDNYNKESVLEIEDDYIIKLSKGYDQLTNKEIKKLLTNKNEVKLDNKMDALYNMFKKLNFSNGKNSIVLDILKINNISHMYDKKYYYLYALFFYSYFFEKLEDVKTLEINIDDIVSFGERFNKYCKSIHDVYVTANTNINILNKTNIRKELNKLTFINYDKDVYKTNKNKIICTISYRKMESFMCEYYLQLKKDLTSFNINTEDILILM